MIRNTYIILLLSLLTPGWGQDCDCDNGAIMDCAGVCGGTAVDDECGVCVGAGPPENYNCDLECTAIVDCNGECGGSAVEDECGVCGGDGPAENYDCAGQCIAGVDCAGVCGGSAVEDECGVCGYNNSISGCTDPEASNYDPDATVGDGSCEYSIWGNVVYYKGDDPWEMHEVVVVLNNTDSQYYHTDTTNEPGYYRFESLMEGNYSLSFSKDEYEGNLDNYFDGLSAVDVSRIARHSVGLYEFNYQQKIAANVNFDYRCEGEYGIPYYEYSDENGCTTNGLNWVANIEAGDASKVARYAAGIIGSLNENCDTHWIFIEPNTTNNIAFDFETCMPSPYEIILDSNIPELDFFGIRLGDVNGNWKPPQYGNRADLELSLERPEIFNINPARTLKYLINIQQDLFVILNTKIARRECTRQSEQLQPEQFQLSLSSSSAQLRP